MRRHHNTKGYRQIKRGRTREQVRAMAAKLGIPFSAKREQRRGKK